MQQQNFSVFRDDSFTVGIDFEQLVDGVWRPIDITGENLIFEMDWDGGGIVKSILDADPGLVIENGAAGQARLSLTKAEMQTAPAGSVPYRFRRETPDESKTIMTGHFKIRGFP